MAEGAPAISTGFLRKKVFGKIPVIYVIGVFVLILAIVAYRMRANSEPTDATDTPAADAADSTDVLATGDTDSLATGGTTSVPQTNPVVGNNAIEDNQTWLRKGVEFLGSKGVGAGNAQAALQAYLNGDNLSYQQGAWRDMVVKQLGLPPEAFQAGTTQGKGAAPAKRQGPLPRGHKIINGNDNTYAKLAQLYYNSPSTANILFIKAANTPNSTLGDGNGPFAVGSVVQIPKFVTPVFFTSTTQINTAREIADKNHISVNDLQILNPGMHFPVAKGTRVRVK